MKLSERKTSTPVGLSRFLVRHREHEGFETLRESSVVTVVCSGCESSFSYLTDAADSPPGEVEKALAEIARPLEGNAANGNGDRKRANGVPAPVSPAERLHEPHPYGARAARPLATARRLAPPGPLAPRRRRNPPLSERYVDPVAARARRIYGWASPRRRTIGLTALAIAGGYLFVALALGGEGDSSSTASGPPEVTTIEAPLASIPAPPITPDEGPTADAARPLQPPAEGGPGIVDETVPSGNFTVAMPPDWSRGFAADGSTRLSPNDGGAEVVVRAQPRGTVGLAAIGDEAAIYLTPRIEPGTPVTRLPWDPVGNLMAVAQAVDPGGQTEIAYVGVTPVTRYLVVRSLEPDASALVRLQADGIVNSITAQQ